MATTALHLSVRPGESDPAGMLSRVLMLLAVIVPMAALTLLWWLTYQRRPRRRVGAVGSDLRRLQRWHTRPPPFAPALSRPKGSPGSTNATERQRSWRRLGVSGDGDADQPNTCLTCTDMITPLLTEGDLDRGRPPELKSPPWRCGIVDPATGAACTLRPHTPDKQH